MPRNPTWDSPSRPDRGCRETRRFPLPQVVRGGLIILEEAFSNRPTALDSRGTAATLVSTKWNGRRTGSFQSDARRQPRPAYLSNERHSLSHPLRERHVNFASDEPWLDLGPNPLVHWVVRPPLGDVRRGRRRRPCEQRPLGPASTSCVDEQRNWKAVSIRLPECSRVRHARRRGAGSTRSGGIAVGTTEELHLDNRTCCQCHPERGGLPVLMVFVSADILKEQMSNVLPCCIRDGMTAMPTRTGAVP